MLVSLAAAMKDSDMARIELEQEHFPLERERMEFEASGRAAERSLRKHEWEAHNKLKFYMLKLMMETFASVRK